MKSTQEIIKSIRKIARKNGWAVGVHGSLKRDIDLIAVPWTDRAAPWYRFFSAVERVVGYEYGSITKKPLGRMAFLILQKGAKPIQDMKKLQTNWKPMVVDFSIVDPRVPS